MLLQTHDDPFGGGNRRQHPWSETEGHSEEQYQDFKAKPELITTVLEDFVPYTLWSAIQHFYELLRWLNGEKSALESSDCGFSGIVSNDRGTFPEANKYCYGRLVILYRSLKLNTVDQYAKWLRSRLHELLQKRRPDLDWTGIQLHFWSTGFTEISAVGNSLVIIFSSWGRTDEEVMKNLDSLFVILFDCLKRVSKDTKNKRYL